MNRIITLFAVTIATSGIGCSNTTTPGVDMAGPTLDMTPSFPAAPSPGAQIDRMGRPGINTALTDPFWDDGVQTAAGHHAKQDAYNQSSDPTAWASLQLVSGDANSTVTKVFEGSIGAYDSVDGTCGNVLTAAKETAKDYSFFTSVLADDELYVYSDVSTCAAYLGVEAAVLGGTTPADCGGRTPAYNTIDVTYLALIGAAVSNGVTQDADGNAGTTFPYLGAAN